MEQPISGSDWNIRFLTYNLEQPISGSDWNIRFLTYNLEQPISGSDWNCGLVLVRDKKLPSSENYPDRLWGPTSIIFNHHCGPLHKRSRGHCVKPITHLLMARLTYGKDYSRREKEKFTSSSFLLCCNILLLPLSRIQIFSLTHW